MCYLSLSLVHRRNLQRLALKPRLSGARAHAVVDLVGRSVVGVDGKELGLDAVAKDASAAIPGGTR